MRRRGSWSILLLGLALLSGASGFGQGPGYDLGFGTIRGSVKDDKDRALPEIRVRAINRRTDQLAAESRTDASGSYELSRLSVGRYALSFYSPEHQTATLSVVDVRREEVTQAKDVVMVRARPFAVIAGATFNRDGFTLAGARVLLERVPFESEPVKSLKMEQQSNSTGEFAFRLAAGRARFRITTSAEGYESSVTHVEIDGAERRNVSVRLQPRK